MKSGQHDGVTELKQVSEALCKVENSLSELQGKNLLVRVVFVVYINV